MVRRRRATRRFDVRALIDGIMPVVLSGVSITLFVLHQTEAGFLALGAAIGVAPGGIRRGRPPRAR